MVENCTSDNETINTYTAVIIKEDNWWIGWIEEIPGVNCQENTYEKLIESLKITIRETLEFNKNEALEIAGTGYREEKIRIHVKKASFRKTSPESRLLSYTGRCKSLMVY